ncbi:MAG TPA: ABC transporter permease [Nitrolancea sp.]
MIETTPPGADAATPRGASAFDARRFNVKPVSWWGLVGRDLLHNRSTMIGAAVLLIMVALSIAAPWIAPRNPNTINVVDRLLHPSREHLLGTDQFGRDLLSRVLYGGRLTLSVGAVSVGIGAILGTLLGMLAGYYGRITDLVIMRLIDLLLAFPGILLALGIVAVLGTGMTNIMIAVGISSIPAYTRVVRGSVLSAREHLYVEAARVIGCREPRILVRHLLPNILAPVIVLSSLGTAIAILYAAALSFLGLGVQPPTAEWGAMLSGGRDWLSVAWWITTFPGIAIMLAVICINVIGDGLRDALDPRL